MLLSLDLQTMRVTARGHVGANPNVLAYDPSLRRLYVSAESGNVAVYAERGHDLKQLGLAFLATEAHTVAVATHTHIVYFPLQTGTNGTPQLLIMKPT